VTRAGRHALDGWLETVEPGARESFFLKLFVGGLTEPEVLLEHIAQFRTDTEERLEQYPRDRADELQTAATTVPPSPPEPRHRACRA